MATKRKSVRDLAQEAGLEYDEALVTLWDAGFNHVLNLTDTIGSGDLNRARRALGIATRREIKSPSYWQRLFDVDDAGFLSLLTSLGINVGNNARKLPPHSVSKLRKEARKRGFELYHREPLSEGKPARTPITRQVFVWSPVGTPRDLRYLREDEVLGIHYALVNDFADTSDPLYPAGVRGNHLLASAVMRPQTSIGDERKYPSVETAAAALLHSLIQNHPFHNGNKRSALVSMLVFLDENGFLPTCHEDEIFRLVLQVSQHRLVDSSLDHLPDREVLAIARFLLKNTRAIEFGDRPITWRKLRRILQYYGCEMGLAPGVGNRMNIQRKVRRKVLFGVREEDLKTQVYYGDEGREAERNTLKKIRADLQLDEEHGIDSHAFYSLAVSSPSDFIIQYRKTLHRLAKL